MLLDFLRLGNLFDQVFQAIDRRKAGNALAYPGVDLAARGQRRVAIRPILHRRLKLPKGALGCARVAGLAGKKMQPLQGERRRAVPRGRGVVVARLGPVDQPLVIVAGEEKSAVLPVLELLEQDLRELFRERERFAVELRLQELDQRGEQKSVIVQISVQMRYAVLVGSEKPLVFPHRATDEGERLLG